MYTGIPGHASWCIYIDNVPQFKFKNVFHHAHNCETQRNQDNTQKQWRLTPTYRWARTRSLCFVGLLRLNDGVQRNVNLKVLVCDPAETFSCPRIYAKLLP